MDSLGSPHLSRAASFGASMDSSSKQTGTKVRTFFFHPLQHHNVYDEHLVKGPTVLKLPLVLVYLIASVGLLKTLPPSPLIPTWLSYNTGKTGLT
jgi:hypothetical protein